MYPIREETLMLESERGDGDRDTGTQRNSKKQMTDTQKEEEERSQRYTRTQSRQLTPLGVYPEETEGDRETEDIRRGKHICQRTISEKVGRS